MTHGGVPLDEIEAAVQAALRTRREDGLRVLGYGEITLVLGWPHDTPTVACKRLPTFPAASAADRYAVHFEQYLAVLEGRGVVPTPSSLRMVAGTRPGERVGYVVQPALDPGALGPAVLRASAPDPEHPLLRAVCDAVPRVVDERTGFDGQISNWAWCDGAATYLDVSTPMLFGADGRLVLDTGLFLAAYPWLLRAPIDRFVVPGVVGAYRDARHVLLDLVANLHKERLEGWIDAALVAANEALAAAPRARGADDPAPEPITADEARRYYRSDARLWEAMLRLRRADRWWQQRLRRRTYPFLLPGPVAR